VDEEAPWRSGPPPTAPAAADSPAWAFWILILAVVAAYATSFAGDFQFDDEHVIVNEPRVRSLAAWWASMPGIRPILKLSFALNQASGLGLTGFHGVNIGIHAANALLAYAIFRRLGSAVPRAALLGALLFALHPVQTEAVTYISGRSSSLAASFALSSILAWLVGRDRPTPSLVHIVSPLLFLASLLVKESTAALPLALVLIEAAFGPRPFRWGDSLKATAVHWLVLAAAASASLAAPTYRHMLERSLAVRDPLSNLLTHVHALSWLTGQLVRIDLLNADPALPVVATLTPAVAVEAVLLLATLVAGLVHVRSSAGFAALWFLVWLPASGWLIPRPEPANDRQLYMAILGPAWLAGRWLASLGGFRRAATVALLLALGAATAVRSLVYLDDVHFWEDVVKKSPQNARAHNNLGVSLAEHCNAPAAEAALVRALELDPGYVRAAVNLRLLRDGEPLSPPAPGQRKCQVPPATSAGP